MSEVFFYHLERSRPEEVLPSLLEKTLAKGWRAIVKLPTPEALEAMDEALWTYRDDSFLPHGPGGEEQPVLLTLSDEAANGAQAAFLAPGAHMAPETMKSFARTVLLFEPAGAPEARETWRRLKDEGMKLTYWQQALDGKWAMKASS
ncbi:MAG: DNA polymerase III subunit chi [Parvularcula sp.]|jgi:DNA polymerase-3 subunit chi|nr:DNA polymerase III subunit chi [Parvularcula sp.]